MSDVQMTHSTDCWKWHHECAKRAVEELAIDKERLRAENERLRAENSDELKSELWKLTVEARNLRIENKALRQDTKRLDWLEKVASLDKVELAKSLLHTGFEIGEWPSMRVTMRKGTLRDVIDAAMTASGSPESP